MPSERQFDRWAEDPHLIPVIARLRRKRRLAQVHLARDCLHEVLWTPVEHDAERVTAEGHIGEDIDQPVTETRHGQETLERLPSRFKGATSRR
jgi:hypothetical protein